MSETEKVEQVLKELNIVESILKPYEWYSDEVPKALNAIKAFRENLKNPETIDWSKVLDWVRQAETQLNYYRGTDPAEEILVHVQKVKHIIGET